MNLGRLLTQTAQRLPEQIGLVQGQREWCWREINTRVDAVVAALRARGIGKGDRILVQARNSAALFESSWIAFKLGAVWVPTNFRSSPDDIAWFAKTSGAVAMIFDAEFREHKSAACAAQPDLRLCIATAAAEAGEEDYEALIAEIPTAKTVAEEPVDYNDPLWFFFTSGTTGRPKAAVLTHGQMAFVVNNHICDLMPGLGDRDVSLAIAPLSHGAGCHALPQVARGAKTVLLDNSHFDAGEAWALIEKHGVTNMFTVPSIVKTLVEHGAVDKVDHGSLRHIIYAGAPMYREDQRMALRKLGSVLVQYYGLGEVTGNITFLPPHLHAADDNNDLPIGSCGMARTGMDVAVLDPQGRRLGANENGEICARGPAVCAGYYDNAEANEKAFAGGWFHTGDVGHRDANGFFYITGRQSDMYISGGSNVYPREIEELALIHPAVAEVAIFGIPHSQWGEAGAAAVVVEDSCVLTEDEFLSYLGTRLARYKLPTQVRFVAALPKTSYGKIDKKQIRAQFEADTN